MDANGRELKPDRSAGPQPAASGRTDPTVRAERARGVRDRARIIDSTQIEVDTVGRLRGRRPADAYTTVPFSDLAGPLETTTAAGRSNRPLSA